MNKQITILLLLVNFLGFSQWQTKDLSSYYDTYLNQFNSVYFLDQNTGWMGTSKGEILHTSDGGGTWEVQNPFSSISSINDIYFVDENQGYAVSSNGSVIYTSDLGANWTSQSGTNGNLIYIEFFDSLVGICGSDDGDVYKTVDAGQNWLLLTSLETHSPHCYYALDSDNIWASGNGFTYRYSNNVWDSLYINEDIYSSYFSDTLTGWIVGANGYVGKTIDGGETWTSTATSSGYLFAVDFIDENNGWAVGDDGVFKYDGKSWSNESGSFNQSLTAVFMFDDGYGWATSWGGKVVKRNATITNVFEDQLNSNETIFPNPTTGFVHLKEEVEYIVLDVYGKVMLESRGQTIDLSGLENGMYVVKTLKGSSTIIKE